MIVTSSSTTGPVALIELRGVTKVYGRGGAAMPALRGVDMTVNEG
jgi:hypothetical protein